MDRFKGARSDGTEVLKITPDGLTVTTYATGLWFPDGIDFGPAGELYIGNRGDYKVMVVPSGGGAASVVASGFDLPGNVLSDNSGNVYVANSSNGVISKITTEGTVEVFGTGFVSPIGLDFDLSGNLLIASWTDGVIYKVVGVLDENEPPAANAGEDQTVIVGRTLTLDGSASSDEDGEIVSYDWDLGDGETGDAAGIEYTYESAGEYTVTLTVTDDGDETGEDTLTVTVLLPGDAVAGLISDIEELGLHKGIANSLTSKLKAAAKAYQKGKDKTAVNVLNAFINEVEAQQGKKISDEDADFLIDTALWIIG